LPAKIGKKAIREAVKRLGLEDEDELMNAIGANKLPDRDVMEALIPGSTAGTEEQSEWPKQEKAISIRGLTPGVGFQLAECCHPVPGDRIVGLRKAGAPVEVHAIDCLELASGIDADWIDLSWGRDSHGAIGRLRVILYDRPGTLAEMAGLFAQNHANVVALEQTHKDHPFSTYEVELDVEDLAHLTRILSALRASDAVAQAERL
jgi:GTP pyrophosphokinase